MSRGAKSRPCDVVGSVYMRTLLELIKMTDMSVQHYEEGRPEVNITMMLLGIGIV